MERYRNYYHRQVNAGLTPSASRKAYEENEVMMSEQIPLFEDEYVLRNDAVGALIALNLDEALSAFQRHHDLYRDNGDIDKMMAVANFLQQGLAACPENGPDRPGCLFTFWNSFENSMEATQAGYLDMICQIRPSFFRFLVKAIEEAPLPDSAYLSHRIPIGYAYLQIGRYDRAIRSLQTCLIVAPRQRSRLRISRRRLFSSGRDECRKASISGGLSY